MLNRTLTYFLTTSILAIVSILIGLTPDNYSWQPVYQGGSFLAYSQDLTDNKINQYAQAVVNIEVERQRAYNTVKTILGTTPPDIICNKPETFRSLVPDAQKVAVNYCVKAKSFVENVGLTVTEFNSITQKLKTNPALEKRIQKAMLQLKNNQP